MRKGVRVDRMKEPIGECYEMFAVFWTWHGTVFVNSAALVSWTRTNQSPCRQVYWRGLQTHMYTHTHILIPLQGGKKKVQHCVLVGSVLGRVGGGLGGWDGVTVGRNRLLHGGHLFFQPANLNLNGTQE